MTDNQNTSSGEQQLDDRESPFETAQRTGEYRILECEGCRRMRPHSAGKCQCGHGSSMPHNICPECCERDAVVEQLHDWESVVAPVCEACGHKFERRSAGGLR